MRGDTMMGLKSRKTFVCIFVVASCLCAWPFAFAGEKGLLADEILDRVETRYDCESFSATFKQTSTLKAMNITDTAGGTVVFKRPRKFRWVYSKPDKQYIISDGVRLWIFKPDEKQVMVGKAPTLFGNGRGASFFSDIKSLRTDFSPGIASDRQKEGCYILKLTPKQKSELLNVVYMEIDKSTFEVTAVETVNAYGDDTRLEFSDREFCKKVDDSLFTFDIPIDADVITLDNES